MPLKLTIKAIEDVPETLRSSYKRREDGSGYDLEIETDRKNPWLKEHWNITEQGKVFKANRSLAEALAEAAGHSLAPSAPPATAVLCRSAGVVQVAPSTAAAPARNPWKKDSWNITAQGQIYRKDQAEAHRLAAEAGRTVL